jgi:peptide chain release factor 1
METTEELTRAVMAKLDEFADRRAELEEQMADPDLVNDSARLATVAQEHGRLGKFTALHDELLDARQQAEEARELVGDPEEDPEFQELAQEELQEARQREQQVVTEVVKMLVTDDEHASRNVIVEIRAGTGGDEAALFAMDLYGMYSRYAEKNRWKIEPMDSNLTDLGGAREIVFSVKGNGAWQKLQYESGGHRVQRVPETESQGRIHTSLATVAVLPEAREVDVELDPSDIEMSFMRSSGPGGQHVNKTSSCVRLVHEPTGISVRCQDQKSQGANRRKAMELLRTRIYDMREQKRLQKRRAMRKSQIGSGDRNQRIRTYNFPQDRITDHRIGLDVFGIENFLMGNCDRMFDALAEHDRAERIEQFMDNPDAELPI